MNSILKKIRQSDAFNQENRIPYTKAVLLMSLFTFTFLGTEFLFVDMISRIVSGNQSVSAQNYALGISVIGFVLYPLFCRICKGKLQSAITFGAAILSAVCLFLICRYSTYTLTMCMGLLLFLILGAFGSAVFYKTLCLLEDNTYIARLTGVSYMLGILFQIANNNLIHTATFEAGILSSFILLLAVMLIRSENNSIVPAFSKEKTNEDSGESGNGSLKIAVVLILFVTLLTCIFSTLDNAVTLVHAGGTVDIGQWPRILLALSGLAAGFVFDIKNRKYMGLVMYCVMVLSTICIVVLKFGGSFLVGLIVFYLSTGFFAVFFTSGFMELSRHMRIPELWAGMGRAVNNITAALIANPVLALLSYDSSIAVIVLVLFLFVAVSTVAVVYTFQKKAFAEQLITDATNTVSEKEKVQKFMELFSFTEREAEVFGCLVNTEDSVQAIAENLYVSRRTLERYISAIYEKTGVKSRVGLLNLYNK